MRQPRNFLHNIFMWDSKQDGTALFVGSRVILNKGFWDLAVRYNKKTGTLSFPIKRHENQFNHEMI